MFLPYGVNKKIPNLEFKGFHYKLNIYEKCLMEFTKVRMLNINKLVGGLLLGLMGHYDLL